MSDWFQLPHLAGIRITGPDAIAFAHSQFTSAFTPERTANWELTARCNPKGRVLELMLSRIHEDDVELIVPTEQAAQLAKALNLYAIGRRLQVLPCPIVSARHGTQAQAGVLLLDPERCLSLDQPESPENALAVLNWQVSDLKSGIAWLNGDSAGEFLPQALGLEDRGGLSYRKGCYPGQEIIARVHYLGRAKERLSGFLCDLEAIGHLDILDMEGRKQGRVISAIADDQGCRGLAVISSGLDSAQELQLGAQALRLLDPEAL